MHEELLDHVPLWGVFVGASLISWLALECGYRLGRWRRAHASQEKEGPVGAIVGSILALLAFMLAFTCNIAATRFDARRQTVLDEANAIGTTYLRTRMLPEPLRSEAAKCLREYVDLRINDGRHTSSQSVADAIARSEQLHEALWIQATAAAEKNPSPITGLFVQSLNEMIDIHSKRILIGLRSRLPLIMWAGLMVLTILGMVSVGYQTGLAEMTRSPAIFALVFAFASVLYLIADLDRPGEGGLTTNQEALIDLQRSMKPPVNPPGS